MAEEDQLAGMDEEGLRRVLGELLASNRATQANLEAIQRQFPIQPSSVADGIPTWQELEEGGLTPPNPEEGEPSSFAEQLGVGFSNVIWVEVRSDGVILRGGEGLIVERVSKGIYKIWRQGTLNFKYPGALRAVTPSTAGLQAVAADINLIESKAGLKGYEIVLVENVAGTTYVDANFHFFAATLTVE